MFNFRETGSDSVILISFIGLFSGIASTAFLTTGLDVPIIMIVCALAAWTGIRKPRASRKQICLGWFIGGISSLAIVVLSLILPNAIPLVVMMPDEVHAIILDVFWTAIAIPTIGIVCALRGRQWRDKKNRWTGVRLFVFAICISFSPITAIFVVAALR
jgi:chromate transport protein ChrA